MSLRGSLVLVAALSLFRQPAEAQGQQNFPNFVGVGVAAPQVVIQAVQAQGQLPAPTNSIPIRLTAQLVRNISLNPPFQTVALTLAALPAGLNLTKADQSTGFAAVCTLTQSNTMAECQLTPSPGPNWGAAGPLVLRVRLMATDGNTSETLVAFNLGLAGANLQTSVIAALPSGLSTTDSTPLLLTAQLVRNSALIPPGDSAFLPIAALPGGASVTKSDGSAGFSSACSLTNASTLLECVLTPSPGPTWGGNVLIFRVRVTGVEGTVGTALQTVGIGTRGAGLQVQVQCGTGACPTVGNSSPIYLAAQMVRAAAPLPPGEVTAATLTSSVITKSAFSLGFTESCSLTNANTMLECLLMPSGATWASGGPVSFRLRVNAVDGNTQSTLVTFRVN
ncbi:MAG: hypothetical protein HYR60_11530 [Acidobacteria bacterium]|nr:hypothetical protein [Acidobacteriota bacterium]